MPATCLKQIQAETNLTLIDKSLDCSFSPFSAGPADTAAVQGVGSLIFRNAGSKALPKRDGQEACGKLQTAAC